MQIGTRVRYALRAAFDIAYHGNRAPVQAGEISRRQRISARYLEQILHKLKGAGIVGSRRGPRGGYFLHQPPAEVSVHDLLLALEGPVALVPCVGEEREPGAACPQRGSCPARLVWDDAGERIAAAFRQATVQDLCERAERRGVPRASVPGAQTSDRAVGTEAAMPVPFAGRAGAAVPTLPAGASPLRATCWAAAARMPAPRPAAPGGECCRPQTIPGAPAPSSPRGVPLP